MKFFKSKDKVDWKYIIREILLIFIGINLAIWFNNWNSSKKTSHDKTIAISKIKGEIENNIKELTIAQENNQFILNAFTDLEKLSTKNSSKIVATPEQIIKLKKQYPSFFNSADSIKVKDNLFQYNIQTFIQLEIPTLTQIAWETTRSIGITNEFNYECLYDLESTYDLQERVQNEIDKASNALQKKDIKALMNILDFINQLNTQLIKDYQDILIKIDSCY